MKGSVKSTKLVVAEVDDVSTRIIYLELKPI